MVHQDVPHHLRGNAEKMGPVLPFLRFLADQPQIRFVDQGRTLQSVIRAFAPETAASDTAQLLIDQRDQRIPRTLIAAAPLGEEVA